jgi:nucleoside-diphosphate-sugar epimerase
MPDPVRRIFVTGATGLVGSHVVEEAARLGHDVRVLVRPTSDTAWLDGQGVEKFVGDLQDEVALRAGARGADWVINCAAKVGDWGSLDDFRTLNVDALRLLLDAAAAAGVSRFVHVSSLGVYEGRDHFGTDETTPPAVNSLDAYTRSKSEAEVLALLYTGKGPVSYGGIPVTFPHVDAQLAKSTLPPEKRRLAVSIVRPGFIYGERDRTVLPKLLDALRRRRFIYFGSGEQALNCIYVKNLVQAIFLAAEKPQAVGEVFNITDGRRVTKQEFVGRVAELAGLKPPTRHLPLGLARVLAKTVEGIAKARGATRPPLINKARFKFLGLNLDYSIEKARRVLGYDPAYTTEVGLVAARAELTGRAAAAAASH